MTLFDEYCYNLMESAIKRGAEGNGLTKDECVAYMNIMFGARGAEEYINKNESTVADELAERAATAALISNAEGKVNATPD